MLNPIKWKHEDQVGLLISIIAGAGLGIVIGYLVNEMARHTYLGAHQRCHSRRGVLFQSARSLALPCPPLVASYHYGQLKNSTTLALIVTGHR
jgi:hypothetical protein